ncbi:hypothetical protein B0A58_10595 [Flavobacterium branchiophilum NBRC 15030 = ATCC 35035]|uniref:Uncharacterized protein n=1 Tax=Flavobacterium branchiophilum TaxID=55197 RepID=A0A543G8B7_9FLAO|nr:hypothetical protein B0A58_10595 [Flavobacterium branchiophilum NBRC 15030 = ATCC 35035]TQM42327.1 hypothetical protein BC670_3378 [Flavobacterium branchiophilum]GEM55514.1 hypothetical protein FB1_17350 [Flavobacterium branchiophilum NBRC 15030 = ATCC 35035]
MIFFNIFNIFNPWVETQGDYIGRPAGTFGVITRITKSHRDDRYYNFGIHPDEVKEKQAIKVP